MRCGRRTQPDHGLIGLEGNRRRSHPDGCDTTLPCRRVGRSIPDRVAGADGADLKHRRVKANDRLQTEALPGTRVAAVEADAGTDMIEVVRRAERDARGVRE